MAPFDFNPLFERVFFCKKRLRLVSLFRNCYNTIRFIIRGKSMKNGQNSWVSEYKRKKFMEKQKKPFKDIDLHYLDLTPLKFPTEIAVMLDLDGTTDYLDDEKAIQFCNQLDFLRQKFGADTAFISLSTHYEDSIKMKKILAILSDHLLPNIKIGMSFYFGGSYDYENDSDIPHPLGFNMDKVATFDNYYRVPIGRGNKWIAILDDGIAEDSYLRYQNGHPMLLGLPSNSERSVSKNNFMRRATTTQGFDGVLEILDSYVEDIKDLSPLEILDTQRNMMMHLSSYELTEKIRKRDYPFLERYFKEGCADEDDYQDTLSWLLLTNSNSCPAKEELIAIEKILELIIHHFEKNKDEKGLENSFQLQKRFGLQGEI